MNTIDIFKGVIIGQAIGDSLGLAPSYILYAMQIHFMSILIGICIVPEKTT